MPIFIIAPLVTATIALVGSLITIEGIPWYERLKAPSFTPPGWVFSVIWTAVYIQSTISFIMFWNNAPRNSDSFWPVIITYIFSGLLNLSWSFVFFRLHKIRASLWIAILLELSVIYLILLIYPLWPRSNYLLISYVGWGFFACILNYFFLLLNREEA